MAYNELYLGIAGLVVYGSLELFIFITAILGYILNNSRHLSTLERNVRIIFRLFLAVFAARTYIANFVNMLLFMAKTTYAE